MGLLSLVWFLVRVIPKPSRAAYPCQRAAFPLASSFVVWLASVLGSAFAWRKAQIRDQLFWRACLWGAGALAGCLLVVFSLPTSRSLADNPAHGSLGVARGVCPGRVAWAYAPTATSWDGYTSPEHWYESNHCDLATVETMLSKAIQSVGGTNSDVAAWAAIFKYYNEHHARGTRSYQTGEKVGIKINLITCMARGGSPTVDVNGTYDKLDDYYGGHWLNSIDPSPQLILSLLRQLVYVVGVNQTNISIGDPTCNFPKYLWDRLHPEFPDVNYFDNYGQQGRKRVEFSSVPFYWSVTNPVTAGQPITQDFVPVPFAQADYLINLAVPKSHYMGGITAFGKNYYGALLRCPDGAVRDDPGGLNYHDMHQSLPNAVPGMGHYRCLVDLMGSPELGGKMLLCIGDLLFSGRDWAATPQKWNSAPFNGDWPSSILVSQDPVAIDSVCYDFLSTEWPLDVYAAALNSAGEDYLHEAAQADNPPSGTFYDPGKTGHRLASLGAHEHWNNATNKQYSRNLDPVNGTGIELAALTVSGANTPPAPGSHNLATTVNTPLTISIGDLAALDYDANGDTLMITAVSGTSTNGPANGVSFSAGTITYSPAWGFVGTDQFTYAVSDGFGYGGTTTNTVNVTVRLGQATSVFNYISTPVGNKVDLRGYGIPTRSYSVQKSGDLVNWQTISSPSATAAANGLIFFSDTNANTSPLFYRFGVK